VHAPEAGDGGTDEPGGAPGGAPGAPEEGITSDHGEQAGAEQDDTEGGGADGEGSEQEQDGDPVGPGPDPLRFQRWMQRSATGAVLTGIALGLREALEPNRRQTAFVIEAPGEPEDPDAPIALRFDPDDPTKTVAVIRRRADDAVSSVREPDEPGDGAAGDRASRGPEPRGS
jgi:hypothetical protein